MTAACGVAGALALAAVVGAVIGALVTGEDQRSGGAPHVATSSPSPGTPATGLPGGPRPADPRGRELLTPEQTLERSELYLSSEVPGTGCPADRRPEVRDAAVMAEFLATVDGCLLRLWTGQFRAARLPWQPPSVYIWDEPGRGPCGVFDKPGVAAFYCPSNRTIYMGSNHIVETAGPYREFPVIYMRLFAHEYGHHVQAASAMVAAEGALYRQDPAPAKRRETIRRGELQADCFAGLFLHAIRDSQPLSRKARGAMYADVRGRGDDGLPVAEHDHGQGATRQHWLRTGYDSGVPRRCNTWSASDADTR